MEVTARIIAVLAAAVWIGMIVFQSLVVAPAVFKSLDERGARLVLRDLFPRFYRLGLGCGLALIATMGWASVAGGNPSDYRAPLVGAVVMTALTAVSMCLVPSINAARDAGSAGAARFKRLHGASVLLVLVTLVLGSVILITLTGPIGI